jgi:putative exosortase-associated protein (TIGR04073 family)
LAGFATMEVEIHAAPRPRPDRPRKSSLMSQSPSPRSLRRNPGPACRSFVRAIGLALVCVLLGILLGVADAEADDSSPRKLGRGLANMTLGVIVVPAQVIETTRTQGPFVGATWGLAKGLGWMVATEAIGVFEFLTCPFETPPDFKPILSPEFPWGHYQDAETRNAKKEVKRRKVFTRDR